MQKANGPKKADKSKEEQKSASKGPPKVILEEVTLEEDPIGAVLF
jgi:hypothetical protein